MTPSRWSSAIAILRRRQDEAADEDRALLHRVSATNAQPPGADLPTGATDPGDARANARMPERLLALWRQITRR